MDVISFNVPRAAKPHILTILDRAQKLGLPFDHMSSMMDLQAAHANGTPLDFERFAAFDDFNFLHDFVGIANHMDRRTGKLTGYFLPRCALPQPARA